MQVSPSVGPIVERPYQIDSRERILAEWEKVRSTLLVLPTGMGKTVTFIMTSLAHQEIDDRPTLIVAHVNELIDQAAEKIFDITGRWPEREQGGAELDFIELQAKGFAVTSMQTMSRLGRLEKRGFRPDTFGRIVIDECHRAASSSYRKIVGFFEEAKVLGVTATPKRTDEIGLGHVFETVAHKLDIADGIDGGYLVPIHQEVVEVKSLDFSKVESEKNKLGENDFKPEQLRRILTEEKVLHAMCGPIVDVCGDRPTLVFAINQKHCRGDEQSSGLVHVLRRYVGERGGTDDDVHFLISNQKYCPKDVRRSLTQRFKLGDLNYLLNVGIATEGFDAPLCQIMADAAPTKSILRYTQKLGRITRPWPGVIDGIADADLRREAIEKSPKPYGLAIDFAGNSGHHKLVNAMNVLEGKYSPEVIEYAKDNEPIDKSDREKSIEASLDRAQAEMALEAEEQERRRRILAEVEYQRQQVNPFGGSSSSATSSKNGQTKSGTERGSAANSDAPTKKQRGYMKFLGYSWEFIDGVNSKKQAGILIDQKLKEKGKG